MARANHSTPLVYLTVNDGPSGVYTGQVIDVVRLLREVSGLPVRLVALVPMVLFRKHRKAIRSQMSDAIVIPMVPKLRNWRFNLVQLVLVFGRLGRCSVIARNPLAANLALTCRRLGLMRRVCYDGRGAVAAETKEYSQDNPLEQTISDIERRAVCDSDFRIAVSSKLVQYWEREYGYNSHKHVVIPCSYARHFDNLNFSEALNRRRKLGFSEQDVVFVYSGGLSGWQSARLVQDAMSSVLGDSSRNKLLLLAMAPFLEELVRQFPQQVRRLWIESDDLPITIAAGDYGILLREPTVTNQVAAPVKFAEYLACGLPVICSPCVGDYPDFIRSHKAGFVIDGSETRLSFSPVSIAEKTRIQMLAKEFFSKQADRVKTGYGEAIEAMTGCN
jgi:glycosyltransferase involved in cell wall biosynthesis